MTTISINYLVILIVSSIINHTDTIELHLDLSNYSFKVVSDSDIKIDKKALNFVASFACIQYNGSQDVSISRIFHSTALNRRLLNQPYEFDKIVGHMQLMSVYKPSLDVKVYSVDSLLHYPPTSCTLHAFNRLHSTNFDNVLETRHTSDYMVIEGFVAMDHLNSALCQHTFINQHHLNSQHLVHQTTKDALEKHLGSGNKHAIFVLKIHLRSVEHDIEHNTIQFHNQQSITSTLNQIFHDFVSRNNYNIVSLNVSKRSKSLSTSVKRSVSHSQLILPASRSRRTIKQTSGRVTSHPESWLRDILHTWQNPVYNLKRRSTCLSAPSTKPLTRTSSHSQKITRSDLRQVKVIGQVDKKFIAALSSQTMLIFDQHAVDERVKLEEYMSQLLSRRDVLLVSPSIRVQLTALEVYTLLTNPHVVEQWGFLVREHDGSDDVVCITTLPQVIHDRLLKDLGLLRDIIRECVAAYTQDSSHTPPTLLSLVNSKACRNAIKFGDVLSNEEAQSLLDTLLHTKNPYQCAHGRPTLYPVLQV